MNAFRIKVDFKKVYFEGIAKISADDIKYAADIGYIIKLLAIAKSSNGEVEVRVHPTFVPEDHALALVSGPMNAIYVKGDAVGELMFYGQGAGGDPTASAVVNDIVLTQNPLRKNLKLKPVKIKAMNKIVSRYYLHMIVPDRAGVLAHISKVFAEEKVSIQSVIQKESTGSFTPLIIILHAVVEANFNRALNKIKRLNVVQRVQNVIRVGL
jgi:homoserine dehydrogenase